jgi:hypothetical protein
MQQSRNCWKWCFLCGLHQGYITRTSSSSQSREVVWRLPEPWESKIWSWVLWDSEPRITMLVRASSNLAVSQPESWDSKIWSWVQWDWEPRMTLLARVRNNLPDQLTASQLVSCKLAVAVRGWPWGISIGSSRYLALTSDDNNKQKILCVL